MHSTSLNVLAVITGKQVITTCRRILDDQAESLAKDGVRFLILNRELTREDPHSPKGTELTKESKAWLLQLASSSLDLESSAVSLDTSSEQEREKESSTPSTFTASAVDSMLASIHKKHKGENK
jgi:hypothetical protein